MVDCDFRLCKQSADFRVSEFSTAAGMSQRSDAIARVELEEEEITRTRERRGREQDVGLSLACRGLFIHSILTVYLAHV